METKTVCPVFASGEPEFEEELKKLDESACDCIEIRLDRYYPKHTLIETVQIIKKACRLATKQLLFTMRTEGGESECNDDEYRFLMRILEKDSLFYDIELSRLGSLDFEPDWKRVVLSYHNFDRTPGQAELFTLMQKMNGYRPAYLKIACMAKGFDDVLTLASVMVPFQTESKKILVSMGEAGMITRVVPWLLDSAFTFCSYETASAPGQVCLSEYETFQKLVKDGNDPL